MKKVLIARNFKLLREKMDITQSQMAEYLGLSSRESISQYENCDRDIPLETLEKCCNIFGVELIDIFEEDEALVKTNFHFAFRADELNKTDMDSIIQFKQIIGNQMRMLRIENNEGADIN
jgi:transcriptional regulator with XRE-family HTH domain